MNRNHEMSNPFSSILRSIALLAVPALLIAGCASTSGQQAAEQSADTTQSSDTVQAVPVESFPNQTLAARAATLTVTGMSCPMCSTNLELELKDMDAVQTVAINLEEGAVDITLGGPNLPTQRQLAQLVHDAGYNLVQIQTR